MYFRVQDNKLYDYADYKYSSECYQTDICTQQECQQSPNKYIVVEHEEEIEVIDYDLETGEPIGTHIETKSYYSLDFNPNFEAEEAEKEKERIANLKCTKRVFALMLQELGIDYLTVLLPLIESNSQAKLEWDLCVELERKNPLLDIMASQLGVTSKQLDGLFKYANKEITLEEFKTIQAQGEV